MDLVRPPDIPKGFTFVEMDILEIGHSIPRFTFGIDWVRGFDFICASTPCEQFSTMRNFSPPVPYPELGIKLFNHVRAICEASGLPYVMENVAGAQKYVGRAVSHCGSYYLWGSGVPAMLPQGISKGMTELAMGLREHKGKAGWDDRHGTKGRTPSALVATIPPELAGCVANYAERLLEQAASR